MQLLYFANVALWIFWGLYWFLSSFKVKKTTETETKGSRLIHLFLLVLSFLLLFSDFFQVGVLAQKIFWNLPFNQLSGTIITFLGLSFTIWARIHLGKYWSGTITIKEGHKLIQNGPYSLARHPIYTGFLLGIIGSAITVDEVRGLIAILLVFIAYARKIHIEEKFLIHQFGNEYLEYKNKVKALIPFIF